MVQDIIIPIVSFLVSLLLVIGFIAFVLLPPVTTPAGVSCAHYVQSWYIVWTLFLKRFKFVRELMGLNETESKGTENPKKSPKSKSRRD